MDLALNNLQKLICHKTQTTNQPTKFFCFIFYVYLFINFSTQNVKQCSTCQRTNYHDTTNYNRYFTQLEPLWARDQLISKKNIPKYCKTFDSAKN